jgi:hypothetical protein
VLVYAAQMIANVDPETNTKCSFVQPQDPRTFTAIKWPCSHHPERAKLCQDGTVIREHSNAKRSKRLVARRSRRSNSIYKRPTSQLGSPTRDTHHQDACRAGVPHHALVRSQSEKTEVSRGTTHSRLAGVPCHALIRGRSERSDARQQTRVNIKYVTKVTCHAIIIKRVCTFATEFTGPVHLQGQVVHFQQSSLSATLFSSFLYFLLLAGSSGFFN